MACGNCGTGTSGKPGGCQSNGGCSSGGCNRLNVHDWLAGLPLSDSSKPYPIIEVSFKQGSRKEFFRNTTPHLFEKGEWITVEGASGFDVGRVSVQGELVKLQMKKYNVPDGPAIKRVLRPATPEDIEAYHTQKAREQEIMVRSRAMARTLNLDMKIAEVDLQADGRKGTFFYTADARVDFRELIKSYASEFHMKVEMRQIGARQESGKVGGIGSCGRELCCSTWLTDFRSVNTAAARYQNLSINQTKLSGQCGRLKCCLNYELDTYMDALKAFPADADSIETAAGVAVLQKRDIFRSLMWYAYKGSSKQYPLTVARVLEIKAQNKEGVKPEDLGAADLETRRKGETEADKGFVNDVGQISLRALERNSKARKKKGADARKTGGEGGEAKGGQRGGANNNNNNAQREARKGGGQQPKQQQQGAVKEGGGTNKPQPRPARPVTPAEGNPQPQAGSEASSKRNRNHRGRGGRSNNPSRPSNEGATGGGES